MTKRWLSLVLVLTLMSTLFTGAAMAEPVLKGTTPVITFEPKAAVITATSTTFTSYELGTFKSDGALITGAAENNALQLALGEDAVKIGGSNVTRFFVAGSKLYATFTGPAAGGADKVLAFHSSFTSEAAHDFTKIKSKTIATVEFPNPVTSVTVSPSAPELMGKGITQTLTAVVKAGTATDTTDILTWKSDNEKVATVAPSGSSAAQSRIATVTAVDAGTARITATSTNGKVATSTVTVVAVTPTQLVIQTAHDTTAATAATTLGDQTLYMGRLLYLKAGAKLPATATTATYTWTSGNPAVATVNEKGVVTPVSVGEAIITVALSTNSSVKQTVKVTVASELKTMTAVKFSLAETTAVANYFSTDKQLTLTSDIQGASIYYILTSDPDRAEVTKSGVAVPTKSTGTLYSGPITLDKNTRYTVSAIAFKDDYTTFNDAAFDQVKVYDVDIALKEVKVTPKEVKINGIDKTVLTVEKVPANANVKLTLKAALDVTFFNTGAGKSAPVNASDEITDGKLTLVSMGKVGTQTVTVTPVALLSGSKNNETLKDVSAKITVTEVPVTSIVANPTSIQVRKGEQALLKGVVSPATATDAAVKYDIAASDAKIALIDGSGAEVATFSGEAGVYVKGKAVGTSTVFLTASNGTRISVPVTVTAASTQVATPVISATNGNDFSKTTDTVTITCASVIADGKLEIYYTTDGSDPTVSGVKYTAAFVLPNINGTTTVRAYAKDTTDEDALSDSAIATATFTSAIKVTGVKLDAGAGAAVATTKDIKGQGSFDLTAAFTTATGTSPKNKAITWSSDNTAVATVAADTVSAETDAPKAKVTGVAFGTATITATTADGSFKATCKVTVEKLVPEYMAITARGAKADTASVPMNDTLALGAKFYSDSGKTTEVFPTNKAVTWMSSNSAIATVDANGLVNGVAQGTATITATSVADTAVKATLTLTVSAKAINVGTPTIQFTSKHQVSKADLPTSNVTNVYKDGKFIEEITVWLASTTDGADFYYTTDGTAPSTGSTKYDSAKGIKLDSKCTLTVLAAKSGLNSATAYADFDFAIAVTAIKLDKVYEAVSKGATVQLTATFTPANATNKTITWTTGNSDVATVSTSGLVTAKAIGETTITATPSDGDPVKFIIRVEAAVATGVTVTPSSLAMNVDELKSLVAKVTPADAANANVTWTSSDYSVASVDSTGVVTAVKAGTATITATCGTVKGTATVTVTDNSKTEVEPKILPTFTPSVTTVEAIENASITQVIGSFTAGSGETLAQIFAYYDIQFYGIGLSGAVINVAKDGTATLYMSDAGKLTQTFAYSWKLVWKTSQGAVAGALDGSGRTVSGNTLKIVAKPTTITYVDSTPAAYEVSGTTGSVAMGTIGNRADFAATGVALTATVDATRTGDAPKGTVAGFSASVGSDGKVTLNIKDVATGVYNVFVTVSAEGCTDVKTGTVAVTVKEAPVPAEKKISVDTKSPKFDAKPYKKKSVWVLNLTDGTATFSVPGYTATGWKSSKTKLMSIDANGVATLKKAGSTRITVSAKVDGKTVTQLVVIRKMAEQVKLQYKQGRKWIDFDGNPLTVKIGKKSKVLTRVVVVTPAKATILDGSWKIEDPTIATRGTKGYIVGLKEGKTSVTFTAHNGISVSCEFTVANQIKGAEEIIPETEVT
ncbi:MAG: Ig-like domain-containing protein, partial [Christensenellaceae bacterium]|nr:Ig-like domain-containing protein [Christensenellaceae bacterium]